MKTYIYHPLILLVIILVTVSCENELPFNIKDNPPKLVMNAFINADSLTNVLFLNLTGKDYANHIENATVEVHVNGELRETLRPLPMETEYDKQCRFNITGKFASGEVVRIDAMTDDGKYHAWAEVTVPQRLDKIENIDTLTIPLTQNGHTQDYMRYKITFKDRPNEANFYRIIVDKQMRLWGYNHEEGGEDYLHWTKHISYSFIGREDIVLTDGQPSTGDDEDNGLFDTAKNIYGVFDDSRFRDTSYTMTVYNDPAIPYNNNYNGYYEGMDLGEIWGYQADDLFMSNREVDEYLKKVDLSFFKSSDRWQRGDVKYIDSDGNGKVDPGKGTLADHGDLKKIGNATPKYSFGINLNAGYKGFEVSALFQGVAKRQFAMAGAQYLYGANCYFKEHLDYFSAQNPGGYLPRLVDSSTKDYEANAGYNTTRYLLNAAYMRLKNLTVSYNFKPQLVKNMGLSGLKGYFTCDNLFTVTKLPKQFDPETINQVNWIVGGSNAAAPGLTSPLTQNGNGRVYPMNRNFVFGIDVTF